MDQPGPDAKTFHFGLYQADTHTRELRKQGTRIKLREQSFEVLAALLECPGHVVTRDELRRRLWPDGVFVDFENSLNSTVNRLRGALGDSAAKPRYIETLPRVGYRFVGSLAEPGSDRWGAKPANGQNQSGLLRSIAVLPFEDLSPERDQEYLCDGVADELINVLAQLTGWRVVARTSTFAFKNRPMDVREIGRQLKADALIEGGIQRSGRRLRISVQLVDARDGYHIWSERLDGSFDDVFALEDEISHLVARKLHVRPPEAPPVVRPYSLHPEACRLCLLGRHFYCQATRPGLLRAIEHYRQAIECDPSCARAWAGLAECYWDGAEVGYLNGAEDLSNGKHAALRAVELDPLLADAHALLGVLRGVCDFDWPAAEREFKEALRLSPGSPIARERYALFFLQAHSRLDEALAHLRYAIEVDPLSPLLHSELAHLFVLRREYDKAIEEAQHALALAPRYPLALAMLGMVYAFQGRWQELMPIASAMPAEEDNPLLLGATGWVLALVGETDQARALLQQLKQPARYGRLPSWSIAWIHQGLGEADEALRWLNRAVEERDPKIIFLPSKPFWDSLRPDSRFRELLRKMALKDSGPVIP